MELKVYEKEILKNYKYIKKLEEILPLKKAEIELKLWDSINKELKKKLNIKNYDFVESSLEYLLQTHVEILSFKLDNLKTYYKKSIYLGIGRYLGEEGIYFFISDNFLNNKDKKYVSFLNNIKNNDNLSEWKTNSRNLYIDFKKDKDLGNLFNFEYEDFYNLLEEKRFDEIVNIIVKLFLEEYEKLSSL